MKPKKLQWTRRDRNGFYNRCWDADGFPMPVYSVFQFNGQWYWHSISCSHKADSFTSAIKKSQEDFDKLVMMCLE